VGPGEVETSAWSTDARSDQVPTSIRLDMPVVEAFKATGSGWQTRMNDVLLEYAEVHDMLHA
jgi:uncharacterized protein (DUF4415 family)